MEVTQCSAVGGGERIAKSGSFQAIDGQTPTIKILGNVKDSEIDFFLFDPDGKEHHCIISGNQTEECHY